jgi:UDPglucose--hexose-1-phosphate uridylyltransferase
MSDLRYDPLFDQWVVVAENRRERPIEFVPLEQVRKSLICPFCGGNEDETPPAILALDEHGNILPAPIGPDWLTRVIPNKYPTFSRSERTATGSMEPYQVATGIGAQELLVPTPRHVVSLSELQELELRIALQAAQMRIAAMKQTPGIAHATLFLNCRFEAGASVEHVHWQLIGSPLSSPFLQRRAERFIQHRQATGQSLLRQLVEREQQTSQRLVAQTSHWTAFCPFASRTAFQLWIAPQRGSRHFCEQSPQSLQELVELIQAYVTRLESLFGQPGYNLVLHQLPFACEEPDSWWVELFPRLSKNAGFEFGTDILINPVAPEMAARRLR